MSDRTETWGFFILTPRIFRKLECVTWEDRDCEWVDRFQSLDVHSCPKKGSSELEIKNDPGAGKMVVDKLLAMQVVRACSCILASKLKLSVAAWVSNSIVCLEGRESKRSLLARQCSPNRKL